MAFALAGCGSTDTEAGSAEGASTAPGINEESHYVVRNRTASFSGGLFTKNLWVDYTVRDIDWSAGTATWTDGVRQMDDGRQPNAATVTIERSLRPRADDCEGCFVFVATKDERERARLVFDDGALIYAKFDGVEFDSPSLPEVGR